MSASQPPRTKSTHYLFVFTLSFLSVIVLGMVYIEDVQAGAALLVDHLMNWFSQPK